MTDSSITSDKKEETYKTKESKERGWHLVENESHCVMVAKGDDSDEVAPAALLLALEDVRCSGKYNMITELADACEDVCNLLIRWQKEAGDSNTMSFDDYMCSRYWSQVLDWVLLKSFEIGRSAAMVGNELKYSHMAYVICKCIYQPRCILGNHEILESHPLARKCRAWKRKAIADVDDIVSFSSHSSSSLSLSPSSSSSSEELVAANKRKRTTPNRIASRRSDDRNPLLLLQDLLKHVQVEVCSVATRGDTFRLKQLQTLSSDICDAMSRHTTDAEDVTYDDWLRLGLRFLELGYTCAHKSVILRDTEQSEDGSQRNKKKKKASSCSIHGLDVDMDDDDCDDDENLK